MSTRPRDRQTLSDSKTNFKQITFANKKKKNQTIAICLVGDEEYYSFLEYEDEYSPYEDKDEDGYSPLEDKFEDVYVYSHLKGVILSPL